MARLEPSVRVGQEVTMKRHLPSLAISALTALALGSGCASVEKSARGFRLPSGDPTAGEGAFDRYRCSACHTVAGYDVGPAVASPAIPVELGGLAADVPTDGQLVTSIIHPSHFISERFPEALVQVGGESRMPEYRTLPVQDLIDLVAFLHTTYRRSPTEVYVPENELRELGSGM